MSVQSEGEYIFFSNLVQAVPDIAGENQTVRAKKVSGGASPYVQENASGEPYRPKNIDDVVERAKVAGERFRSVFGS